MIHWSGCLWKRIEWCTVFQDSLIGMIYVRNMPLFRYIQILFHSDYYSLEVTILLFFSKVPNTSLAAKYGDVPLLKKFLFCVDYSASIGALRRKSQPLQKLLTDWTDWPTTDWKTDPLTNKQTDMRDHREK